MDQSKEVDEKASREQGRALLKNYRRLSRMTGVKLIDPETPRFEAVPTSDNQDVNRYKEELSAINTAILTLNDVSLNVLYYKYCSSTQLTYYQIAEKVGYSQKSVDKLINTAISEFMDCYKHGELLIYK